MQVVRQWLLRIWHAAVGIVLHMWEFLRRVCSSAERPLHFLKVQLSIQPGNDLENYATFSARRSCGLLAAFSAFIDGQTQYMSSNDTGQKEFFGTPAGQELLTGTIQDIIDQYRDHDIAAEFRRKQARTQPAAPAPAASAPLESDSGWFDAPRGRDALSSSAAGSSGAGDAFLSLSMKAC